MQQHAAHSAHSAYLFCVTYWKSNVPSVNVNIEQNNIFLNKLYSPPTNSITNYAVVGIASHHELQGPGLEFRCGQILRTQSDGLRRLQSHLYPTLQLAKYIYIYIYI